MTAEIAIMNKEAIALAADSAVTMTQGEGHKIFQSANKLFALSKHHPVGIMIYNNASFMGVPWESIIKVYRNKLGKKKFDTLKDYVDDFFNFLENGNYIFPEPMQEFYFYNNLYVLFLKIKDEIIEKIDLIIKQKGEITEEEVDYAVSEIIKLKFGYWKDAPIESIPERFETELSNKYGGLIKKAIEQAFEKFPFSSSNLEKLNKIGVWALQKGIQRDSSGVVIAGFGDMDIFPSLKSFDFYEIVNNKLKYSKGKNLEIKFERDHAWVAAFAQKEMVNTFMEGVDPTYREIEETYLSEIFEAYTEIVVQEIKYTKEEKDKFKGWLKSINKKIIEEHRKRLEKYIWEKNVDPVVKVVESLPKDQLATMAETLVNLTSFKRKVTMTEETVGGPIDVAVISKADGFIWIKRKHYFKAELNPQFIAKYNKED